MDFHPSDSQAAVSDAVASICKKFGDDYWLERDRDGAFPHRVLGLPKSY